MRHGIQQVQVQVEGHKFPLLDVRKQALTDHFQYMRLQKRDTILFAGRDELEKLVGQRASQMSDSELHIHITTHIAHCHIAVWHDHSTVCRCGFTLVTCKEVYDRLLHYTDAEYKELTGQNVHVQALVKRLYLHLLTSSWLIISIRSSSFYSRQVGLCKGLQAPDGTEVTDVLRLFNGDKVVQ